MFKARLISSAIALVVGSVSLAACSGDTGPAGTQGAKGDPGDKGDPGTGTASVSAVVPGHAFRERKLDVTIAGNGTDWASGVKVDFGPGITVDGVEVASPTAIVASITIDVGATVGKRDVKVADLSYKAAFDVEAPIKLTTAGDIAQGSVFAVTAKQLDLSTPFDTTQQGDGLFTPISYPNIDVQGPDVAAGVQGVTLYSVDALILTDVTTPTGDTLLTVNSGPTGDVTSSSNSVSVTARTAAAFDLATPPSGNFTAFQSKLYQITPASGANFVDITPTGANQLFAVLPKSGKWSEAVISLASSKQTLITETTEPFYLVTLSTQAGTFGFTVVSAPAPPKEVEPNDAFGQATPLGSLPMTLWGKLPAVTDVDWYSFTAAAGDVGKAIHVVTKAPDAKTDTVVEVFASNGTTSLGGPSADTGYLENFTSDAIPAVGTYFVKVSYSTFGYSQSNYLVDVSLQ